MKTILRKWGNIIMALGEVLVGILLMIDPLGFTIGIIVGTGILLAAMGIVFGFAYFKAEPEQAAREQNLTKGLCALLGGGFCIFRAEWFLATFPLLTVFYGIGILLMGITKVQWAVDAYRLKREKWQFLAGGAALTLVIAAVVLMNPFQTTAILWTFTAISLIIEAVLDLLALIFPGKAREGSGED